MESQAGTAYISNQMQATDNDLIEEVEAYVVDTLRRQLPAKIKYHNLVHTKKVVQKTRLMAEHSGVNQEEKTLLIIAAWFHDIGFIKTEEGHEEVSAEMAEDFLTGKLSKAQIESVKKIILATRIDEKPNSLLEEIIKDGDMAHLGGKDYFERSNALRQEWKNCDNRVYTDEEWFKINEDFMLNQQYRTVAGQEIFNAQKEKNLASLRKKMADSNEPQAFRK